MVTAPTQRQLTTIHLGGKLGKLFGETWRLAVSSPAEAIRAIDVNTKGKLVRYLAEKGRTRYYKVSLQDRHHLLTAPELASRSGNSDIYIWPTVSGRGSGTAQLIAGILILAVITVFTFGVGGAVGSAFYSAGTAATATAAATAGGLTALGTIAVGIGVSLVLGGISQLLAPTAKDSGGGGLGSNIFQGTIAAGQQGGCVPVVYGTALVSPIPIGIWFGNVDYSTTANAYVGITDLIGLPGGGYEAVSENNGNVQGGGGGGFDPNQNEE
jgi:predicted phage tail protein